MPNRIFSTRLYEPPRVSSHTSSALTGTLTYTGTPKSSMPAATPANSEIATIVLEFAFIIIYFVILPMKYRKEVRNE